MKFPITPVSEKKAKPADSTKLGFGKVFTDYMFILDYKTGKGWHNGRILPFGPISLSPAAACFHYGQTVFEGMKAYRAADDTVRLFRPEENFKRLNHSNQRLCIPPIDEQLCMDALCQLVELEKDWIPAAADGSLYIRPFIIATDGILGVKPGDEYYFIIILSPSGAYYSSGLAPVKIYVEDSYVRAVRGGIGEAKAGGNYAASLSAQDEAHAQGYSQVLWLDGVERKYIEEVGAMNIFFVIGDEVVTPMLNGSILPGITRKSTIELLKSWNVLVTERRISVDELAAAAEQGQLREVFGTGTAAVVSPVGELKYTDKVFQIGDGSIGKLTQRLYDTMTGIQFGTQPDPFGWSKIVCKQ
ncbi:MAG: branched-chain amino acid aminotransferase [Angelakisella sp.]